MYVIILEYRTPLAEIDAALDGHRQWLEHHYADGTFLLSGRQEPRVGGVILAGNLPRPELDTVLAADPLIAGGLATEQVIAVQASRAATPQQWATATPQG